MLKVKHTQRGFAIVSFKDCYGHSCSMQKSSSAERDCIWLGIDDAEPKIMASQARQYGVETTEREGWVPFPVPNVVSMTTRMHLTRKDVKKLMPLLQRFVDTGELEEPVKEVPHA